MSSLLLVRHGQASFGTDDYDRLSDLGTEQARALGVAMSAQGVVPGRIVAGALRRQQETAATLLGSAGWDCDVATDADWNEFDHGHFLPVGAGDSAVGSLAATDSRAFQRELEVGMRAWATGSVASSEAETFSAFAARAEAALRRLAAGGDGRPVVAVTSAGVISWIATLLLGADVEQWIRLNRVCVNAAVTKIVSGGSGVSLVAFNEHSHVTGRLLTYR